MFGISIVYDICMTIHIRILDKDMAGRYGYHTACLSWQEAIAMWFDGNEPIAIRIVNGMICVYRG